jgi:alpha-glucoside transport system permease protein
MTEKNTELVVDPSGNAPATRVPVRADTSVGRVRKGLTNPVASLVALVIGVIWTIPTAGVLIQSFRPKTDQDRTGWWTAFSHPGSFTLDFYRQLTVGLNGNTASSLLPYMANSLAIVIPAAIIPMAVAALAAYALVWIDFPGRDWVYVGIFALQIVPLQVAAVPVLRLVVKGWHLGSVTIIPSMGLSGTVAAIWLAHACFALPLAVFLMHNFMSEVPKDLLEAARIDGANHGQIFRQVMLPLLKPVLAAFAIFQFLWVWNDLFVGSVMSGGNPEISPITVKINNLIGSTSGAGGERLPAAAFISIILPLIVFLSLQRFFVRGLLAGSVKG